MAEYTTIKTLDSVIREQNRDLGMPWNHRYGEVLAHYIQGLRELSLSRVPMFGIKYKKCPIENGRVWIPDGISSIGAVGVEVGGHIQFMRVDPNMLDDRDACGEPSETLPVNPDIPSVRRGRDGQLPLLYTGSTNGGSVGYTTLNGFPGFGLGFGWGWGGAAYYPGMNRNKSIDGYYRMFYDADGGYLLLDRDSARIYSEIVIACEGVPFTPGVKTYVKELYVPYLKAFMLWNDDSGNRDLHEKWKVEKWKMEQRQSSISVADFYEACNLMG